MIWQACGVQGMLPALQPEDTPHEIRSVEYQDYLRKTGLWYQRECAGDDRHHFRVRKGSRDLWPMNDQDLVLRWVIAAGRFRSLAFHEPSIDLMRPLGSSRPAFIPSLYKIIHNERAGNIPG